MSGHRRNREVRPVAWSVEAPHRDLSDLAQEGCPEEPLYREGLGPYQLEELGPGPAGHVARVRKRAGQSRWYESHPVSGRRLRRRNQGHDGSAANAWSTVSMRSS